MADVHTPPEDGAPIWFGRAACGCPTTWLTTHPSEMVGTDDYDVMLPEGDPRRPVSWVKLDPVVGRAYMSDLRHPIIQGEWRGDSVYREKLNDWIDWSPAACLGPADLPTFLILEIWPAAPIG